MSSPKRRTRTTSGGQRQGKGSGKGKGKGVAGTTTTARSRGRERRSKRRVVRPPSRSSSPPPPPLPPSPAPAKRRKLRYENETRREHIYAIKDIIDEKIVAGKRFYKIDWADDSETGQTFKPTWEPEENANEDAVEDWEWEKQRRVLLGDISTHPPAEHPVSQSPRRVETPSYDLSSSRIYVEVPSKSDFLKSRPDFDTAISISASQLSLFPHPGSDVELPPAQFCVVSSQPSQDIFITGSQPATTEPFSPQQTIASIRAPGGISQTTIPDSQDFSTDWSQNPIEVPATAEAVYGPEAHSPRASQNNSPEPSIPSRQPNVNQVSFGYISISTDTERQFLSQQDFPLPPPSARPASSRNTLSGFLTQPDFEEGEFSPLAESRSQSQAQEATATISGQHPTTAAPNSPLDDSHQPAQRVSPLPVEEIHFLSQSAREFFPTSENGEVIPDTSQEQYQQTPAQSQNRQVDPSHQPVAHLNSASNTVQSRLVSITNHPIQHLFHTPVQVVKNGHTEYYIYQRSIPSFQKPDPPMMEDTQTSRLAEEQTEDGDVFNELRAIQLEFMPSHMRDAILRNDQPPTPISPSDHGIFSSVEQDTVEDLEETPLRSAEGTTSWGQEHGPVLFADSMGTAHGSTSVAESNLPSLAVTTPASGAVDPAPADVEMALTAAALSGGLETGLQSSNTVLDTISPSALLAATGSGTIPDTSLGDGSGLFAAMDPPAEPQHLDTIMQDSHEFGVLPSEDTAQNEYIIALPPPARSRPETGEIIRRHGHEIDVFKAMFSRDAPQSLDNKAAIKIDAMLQALNELSNLPPYHKDLLDLSQEEWMRYARDTTSKIAFIYEFLDKLRSVDVNITILAAGGPVIEKVEAVVNQGGFTYRRVHQHNWSQASDERASSCKVVLIDTSRTNPRPRSTENIVIAYDETAESSGLLQPYKMTKPEDQTPLIFSLIGVYSLEHINRRLSPTMDPLEKRLAQVHCLGALVEYADDEDAYEQVPQPHEFAHELVKYMVDENAFHPPPVRWESWDHQRIPEHVFEIYKDTRALMAPYGSRKRAREDSLDESDPPKRARVESISDDVQLSEGLMQRFGNNVRVKRGMAEVPLEKLENLIDLVRDLKAALDKKGDEIKSHVRTIRRFEPKYHEAISDRGKFESQRDQALKERDKVQKELIRCEGRASSLAVDKQQLEAALKELTKSGNPDLAAAAQRDIDLKTAQEKAASLERQLKSSQDDGSFARARYQDASDKAAALGEENTELKLRVKNLETRANDNIVEIHRINAQRTESNLRQLYENERKVRLDREKEIDKKTEEMRNYKARFGSRETRGSSVPRSPRVRQVSSRNTSPVGDSGANGGNGNGAMGGSLFGPRGAHLRDL